MIAMIEAIILAASQRRNAVHNAIVAAITITNIIE
jgi:hypothetical protein